MRVASGLGNHYLSWHRATATFCALIMCGFVFAESTPGADPSGAFVLSSSDSAAGTKTFEAEDFVLLSNSSGELRLEVIGVRDRPVDSRYGFRFVFDDFMNEPLHIVLSQSSQGVVNLTLAVPGFSALEFEKRPGESFVRHDGLLEPHTDAHRDHMLKYGIHTGRIEDFMRLAVDAELLAGLLRFQEFSAKLELDAVLGVLESPEVSDAWLRTRAAVCDEFAEFSEGLLLGFGLEQIHLGDSGLQSWSCVAGLLNLSSSALSFMAGAQSCISCRVTRKQEPCSQCAALAGAGTSSLIVALVECFGDDPEPDPTPPPPPQPPSGGGGLPLPFPAPGGGMMIPITTTEIRTVCVDGVCQTQTIIVITWIWAHLDP